MSKKSQVVIIPCDNYEEEKVYQALKEGINLLGGINSFVNINERILVKPNFLSPADESAAVTTHPAVLKGLFRILQESGYADVIFGDSPGHGSCLAAAKKLYLDPSNTYGARICPMSEEVLVEFPEGMTCKEFYFTKEIAESDAIINVCKMKTHSLERITGGVKNVYGFICGSRKAQGHVKYPNATVFARQLADIHRCKTPRINIMDGIVAMEGNGPGSGDPTPMNVLIFSTDPVAMDSVFAHMIDLNPEAVPTNTQGYAMGIGCYKEEDIEIITPDGAISFDQMFKTYGNPNFNVDRAGTNKSMLGIFSNIFTKFARKPRVDSNKCVECGICVSHCPVPGRAINFTNGKDKPPVYDYSKCIRCYCCQEMCPQSAISSR